MSNRAIPVEALDQQVRELEIEIDRLTVRREMLIALRSLAVDMPTGNGHRPPQIFPGTLTDKVIQYVHQHPGLSSAEVAAGMIQEHAARKEVIGGSDPKKTIQTILGAMVTKKRLRREDERHYEP